MTQPVAIKSADFWVKVVEMLQQNWALIDIEAEGSARMVFPSVDAAERALETGSRRATPGRTGHAPKAQIAQVHLPFDAVGLVGPP
jgi:hypothetical protein